MCCTAKKQMSNSSPNGSECSTHKNTHRREHAPPFAMCQGAIHFLMLSCSISCAMGVEVWGGDQQALICVCDLEHVSNVVCVCVCGWVENVLHLAKDLFFQAEQWGSLPLNDLLLCANSCL